MKKLTPAQFETLQIVAKEKGFEFCDNWIIKGIVDYPYIIIRENEIQGNAHPNHEEVVSFQEALELMIFPPAEIKLNDSYTALVTKDFVKIACQEISFDKVEQVYQKMLELR